MSDAQTSPGPQRTRPIKPGFINHTELASADPTATKDWATKALGWRFGEPFSMEEGQEYNMWSFGDDMGGGIRNVQPGENPGTVPYVEVPEIKPAYQLAIEAGATEMVPPSEIAPGMGWIAIVQAPGGVPMGFWAPE